MTPHALDANENPYPPLPAVREFLEDFLSTVNRYPDRAVTELTQALAERLGVPAARIATGAGSVGVTQHLLHALLRDGGEVVYAWPSFEAYPHLTEVCGGTSVRVPLRDERHDLAAMAEAVTDRTRVVIVCNPNNPTGTAVGEAELKTFLDAVPAGVVVLLDEAYREFVTDPGVPDGVELSRDRPDVVVLRTFSKAHGLAGLRVGYAVAHEETAARIRGAAVPFGVNTLAQQAAVISLRVEDELRERVASIVAERDRLTRGLCALGLSTPAAASQANFVWLPLGERTTAFAQACAAAGATVRAFPGEGARVTVGEPAANDLVLRVAEAFAAS
ncbi:histidinol-phosphate transaminase [Streptomyces sp. NBC_01218]|uniref:histidinol-phosphate transaminase n=1 Tax=unclassified Streptomyces TaxID=2593676 RepID=UPI0023B9DB53|nr:MULTISPECIES: histidinol-phosphate transaminase [unclassified Streptomyces]WEH39171.1 histidinol-phosphate transaminase [Streptomyces sp. AM 2-1-1]WSQ50828.1 histidinol-phosphate transaminase [Streptomyces sp. NBC_01218]